MNKVKIIIEKTKDMYTAYAENVEGIYGGGDTVEEAKESIVKSIRLTIENNKRENIPAILLGEYEVSVQTSPEDLCNPASKESKSNSMKTLDERRADLSKKTLALMVKGLGMKTAEFKALKKELDAEEKALNAEWKEDAKRWKEQ